jgi:trimethylamine--corrinoid protein Co-methyltransferase
MRAFFPTSMAFDVIKEVGPGGNYLNNQHTFKHFKTELWHSDLFDHDNWESWASKGSKTIRDKALGKVCEMVEQEYTPILSPEQEADIDKIVEKAKKDLSGT